MFGFAIVFADSLSLVKKTSFLDAHVFESPPKESIRGDSSTPSASANRSLADEYKEMVRRNDPFSGFKKVSSTRKQWH